MWRLLVTLLGVAALASTQIDGKVVRYEEVRLRTMLNLAGVGELRGKGLASYLIATAKDGYRVVFPLAELDPAFQDYEVPVGDHTEGTPLDERTGPFRLVAPSRVRAGQGQGGC